jgi:hypothetical protein
MRSRQRQRPIHSGPRRWPPPRACLAHQSSGSPRSATTTRDKPVIAVASEAHGVDLVNSAFAHTQVQRAVLRFIEAVTRD